ncbi:MAG: alpha/beta hydrolase [Pseudomonadales bacterium]|nr:alpha/beta hydrolase [Pseudomonadales bacterium]
MPSAAQPTSHSYFSQRLRLHYLDWGNTSAPHMLLVHGSQDHAHAWDWFAGKFAKSHHVLVPDLRGHGDSEWVRGSSYHHADYVYDIDQLVRQRALAPLVVVSHSMGGTLASLYAGVFPENVRALVIIEGVGLWPGWSDSARPPAERLRDWIDNTRKLASRVPRRYPTWDQAYQRMLEVNAHLSAEHTRHLAQHGSNQNEDGSFSWKYDNYTHAWPPYRVPEQDMVGLWQRITCPVLLINGTEGYPHRIGQDGTLAHFRDAEVVDVPGAGHWAHHDRFDDVVTAVRAFLDRVPGGG